MITQFVWEQKDDSIIVHVLSNTKGSDNKTKLNGVLVFSGEEWDALVDSLFLMTPPTDAENYVELFHKTV